MPILFIWNTQSEGKGKKIEIGLGNELSQCIFTFHVRAFSQNPNAFVLSATKDDSKTIVLGDCGREREHEWVCFLMSLLSPFQRSNNLSLSIIEKCMLCNLFSIWIFFSRFPLLKLLWIWIIMTMFFRFTVFVCYILLCFLLVCLLWVLYAVDIYICYNVDCTISYFLAVSSSKAELSCVLVCCCEWVFAIRYHFGSTNIKFMNCLLPFIVESSEICLKLHLRLNCFECWCDWAVCVRVAWITYLLMRLTTIRRMLPNICANTDPPT